MKALRTAQERWRELRSVHSRFGLLIAKERTRLLAAGAMLIGEVGMLLLAPWPVKYLFDGLLVPNPDVSLLFVPQGFPQESPVAFVTAVGITLIAITVIGGSCSYYRQVWAATAGQRMVLKLRKQLYGHLQSLSLRFHRDRRLGDLLLRITGDIPALRDVLSETLIDLIGRSLIIVCVATLLFWIDPVLALVVIAAVLFVVGITAWFGRRIAGVARRQRKKEGIVADFAAESLGALALVKAYRREDFLLDRFARQNRSSMRQGLKGTRLQAGLSRVLESTFAVSTAAVLAVGSLRVVSGGLLTPGDLLVFVSYLRHLNKPLRRFSRASGRIGKAAACAERIGEILSVEPEEVDRSGARELDPGPGRVEFEGVRFAYDDHEVLRGIELRIEAGEHVALLGPNGAGKSTLLHLLLRLFSPTEGRVLVDGADIADAELDSLRQQITLVLQDTFVLGGTVRENLRFAAPDATDAAMLEALERVRARFVTEHPAGLDRELSEGGQNLSGGERRKIALAGALLRPSRILLLDEPTTHVDAELQDELVEIIRNVGQGRTTIAITHDVELLAAFDREVTLERGQVVRDVRRTDTSATGGIR